MRSILPIDSGIRSALAVVVLFLLMDFYADLTSHSVAGRLRPLIAIAVIALALLVARAAWSQMRATR